MNKLNKLFFILLIFTIVSCDESFNPYGDWQDRYALTSILKNDEAYQVVVLTKGYRPDGFDPYTYTNDPSVFGADIRVWYNDSVFIFRDTTVARTDTSRYTSPFHFYYSKDFRVTTRKPIEIEVMLSNGKRLKSQSTTPAPINFNDDSEVIVPPVSKNIVQIIWDRHSEGTYFQPQIVIHYKQNIDGVIVDKEKTVPLQYTERNGESVPVFPPPKSSNTVVYQLDAFSKALQEISEGDPNKQNYTILQKLKVTLTAYDIPASRYVSATSGSADDLTVTVDVPDYTNVDGGLGIFGSYNKRAYDRLRFTQSYIVSFGYNFLQQ